MAHVIGTLLATSVVVVHLESVTIGPKILPRVNLQNTCRIRGRDWVGVVSVASEHVVSGAGKPVERVYTCVVQAVAYIYSRTTDQLPTTIKRAKTQSSGGTVSPRISSNVACDRLSDMIDYCTSSTVKIAFGRVGYNGGGRRMDGSYPVDLSMALYEVHVRLLLKQSESVRAFASLFLHLLVGQR